MERATDLLKPRLGLGTWKMGFEKTERAAEVAALRAGIDIGANVIDTAEMIWKGNRCHWVCLCKSNCLSG